MVRLIRATLPEGKARPDNPVMTPDCWFLLRKEVIQPQVPLRLPCYDFIPITKLTFIQYKKGLRVLPAFMM